MKRNAFGQLILSPVLRFAGEGGEGGGGEGEGDGAGGNGGGDGFKAPTSQEELDRIIAQRVSRAERNAREDERRKLTAKIDDKPKDDANGDKPSGVSETDVDKRINDALAAERLELALERVNDGLDKALEGRTYAASKLFNLDRKQFVKEDGKTVDNDALQKWVKENSTEVEQADVKRRRLHGQGERDSNATGGSVSAGRDLYDENHKKKSSGKD